MMARFLFGMFGVGQLFFETPGDGGGGGGGWPEFEVPAGVGDGGGEPAPAPPPQRQQAQPPAGGPAPAPGQPGSDPRQGQPGGQPGGGGQPQRQGQPGGRQLPQYRSDAIAERDRQAEDSRITELVNAGVRNVLSQALGINQAPAEDPRAARLRDTVFNLIPGLKELVDKQKDILGVLETAPGLSETNKAYWSGVAARSLETLHSGAAGMLLGPGKTSADLDPEIADDIRDGFIRWIDADRTGARVARYESQDLQLVPEFLRVFQTRYIDPARRGAAVTQQTRGQQRQAQPSQGPGGQPPAQQPPRPDLNNEDEVHGRGWAVVQQLRGQA